MGTFSEVTEKYSEEDSRKIQAILKNVATYTPPRGNTLGSWRLKKSYLNDFNPYYVEYVTEQKVNAENNFHNRIKNMKIKQHKVESPETVNPKHPKVKFTQTANLIYPPIVTHSKFYSFFRSISSVL